MDYNSVNNDQKSVSFVGVDIGGTFTDIVVRKNDGTVVVRKVSSTPDDPGLAILNGISEVCATEGINPESIIEFIHGTTVATNTILEHKGARTGLICTSGFRDVLEIARIRMPALFDLTWSKPTPLVRRQFRVEIDERIDATGEIVKEIDKESVFEAIDKLVNNGVESVGICLINSYINPIHEKITEEIIRNRYPELPITCSYQVLPEIKEYERTSTTAVNAYILPKVQNYIKRLQAGLKLRQIKSPLLIVASNGGVVSADIAADYPAKIVASGPAAGVTGTAKLLESMNLKNAITFDMGGTTAKASIIENEEPLLANEYEVREGISTPSRFIKAGGYLLKIPAIDIGEVGNGGGSIAWIDKGGALQVGPISAGANPGPVCYDIGGKEPTVTDANLVLGYLNPNHLGGGNLLFNFKKSVNAIREKIADPLGLSVEEAAYGIRQVANDNMIRAVRAVTIERGRDPRDFSMVTFGGNGGVHGADIAESLSISNVIVPQLPGVFSAVGLLSCDVQHELVSSISGNLFDMLESIREVIQKLSIEGIELLSKEGYEGKNVELKFSADLRYIGQSSELSIPFIVDNLEFNDLKKLENDFRNEYKYTFGYDTGEVVELVNIRLTARGVRENALNLANMQVNKERIVTKSYKRNAYFGKELGYLSTRIIDRLDLTTEMKEGPIIIESYDSTIVVPPSSFVSLDKWGNVVIHTNHLVSQTEEMDKIVKQ
ncbi:hydantoinase/oxoprolinase family protein [Fredinandcohnia onubensis]|uniref:hydantoinase/oxoprolinase family protein n=1 Tax=Fredinandcohnia onubensis TaxID=1571209 RepID=UPI000C0BCED8|nr:hydantoinase/oxoprolinase family protein [Fredinandcohnia onubensis]